MITKKENKKPTYFDLDLISKIEEITNHSKFNLTKNLSDLCRESLREIKQKYPVLTNEFEQALLQTIDLASQRIIIDHSNIVSPLAYFANKYDEQEIFHICNQITSKIFDIQTSEYNNKKQNIKTEHIEF